MRCGLTLLLLPVALATVCLSGWAQAADALSDDRAQERYIVRFKESAALVKRDAALSHAQSVGKKAKSFTAHARSMVAASGASLNHELPSLNAMAVRLNNAQRAALAANPMVAAIEPDPPRYPLAERVPYGVGLVQSQQLPIGVGSDIKVCVVDSGFDLGHPDLPGAPRVTGQSGPGVGSWFEDATGHGTHVAGTIMALANTTGVVGVTNGGEFSLHVYRVFPEGGQTVTSSDVIRGVQACAAAGAKVVNLSLGCTGENCFSQTEQLAFQGFAEQGLLVVAAAGNNGRDALKGTMPSYPAGYSSVISVAAVDENSSHASFSQRYPQVELAAPGVRVESTVPRGSEVIAETEVLGESFATSLLTHSPVKAATGSLVDCGVAETTCQNAIGKICLIGRGNVLFADKARHCAEGGGVGAIIYNNISGLVRGTLGADNTLTIPVVGVSDATGSVLRNRLGQLARVAVRPGDYAVKSGTSMAAPHVAGVAALVWSHAPEMSNTQIREGLQNGALDLGATGRDSLYGFGLVRAVASLTGLKADVDGDSVSNASDNCPFYSNAAQLDQDLDARGDACDSDVDGDGMSNAYESEHGLNASVADGLADGDRDGFSNLAEFYAASSSSDAGSVPLASTSSSLVAALLPSSRSARVGDSVTAFATLINTTYREGKNCSIAPVQPMAGTFEYFSTDAHTNAVVGVANTPVTVAANRSHSFVLRFTPTAALAARDIQFQMGCDNLGTAAVVDGLSTLLLSASNTPAADVIALAATASDDGVVRLGSSGSGAFGVASINLGVSAQLTVSVHASEDLSGLALAICETDSSGGCVSAASEQLSVAVGSQSTPTFSVFVQSSNLIAFDPASSRVQVQFRDASGAIRGATSVAVSRPR